jgi:ZIP family zinc transporter
MTRETNNVPIWFPAAIGFLLGGAFIRLIDLFLPHLHLGFPAT